MNHDNRSIGKDQLNLFPLVVVPLADVYVKPFVVDSDMCFLKFIFRVENGLIASR